MNGAAPAHVVITREDASARGLKRYFTGRECRNGHIAERLVSRGVCVLCEHEKSQRAMRGAREKAPRKTEWGAVAGDIVEPRLWPLDDHIHREPVLDPVTGHVIRFVGWRACMCCKRSFFSRDVRKIRCCDTCKGNDSQREGAPASDSARVATSRKP